ncbi:MAG: hypothetical protein KatS3mg010_2032 [Acidimicrobiia bacterium]|nr:MAG: hypothetical protein KatS3mg010_2032 [Acidimicrobiia bacterium]
MTTASAAAAVASSRAWSGSNATGGRPSTGRTGAARGAPSSTWRRVRERVLPVAAQRDARERPERPREEGEPERAVGPGHHDGAVARGAHVEDHLVLARHLRRPVAQRAVPVVAGTEVLARRPAHRLGRRGEAGGRRARHVRHATGMAQLSIGDRAPAFALKDQDGNTVRLSHFKGRPVVVYFYPKADTPGCTQQSCNLRDAFPQLKKLKAAVVGISPDPPAKQKRFDEKYGLGFPLLADEDHAVAQKPGACGANVRSTGAGSWGSSAAPSSSTRRAGLAGCLLQGQPEGHRAEGAVGPRDVPCARLGPHAPIGVEPAVDVHDLAGRGREQVGEQRHARVRDRSGVLHVPAERRPLAPDVLEALEAGDAARGDRADRPRRHEVDPDAVGPRSRAR